MNAIIIGAGITGLTLASQISSFFDQVTIIDPNISDLGLVSRKGVLQGNHLHVLLKNGQDILFDFFPEFKSEFIKDCPIIDWAQDTKWENISGAFPQYPSSTKTFSFSRGYLEGKLVEAVRGLRNVSFIETKVTGFITKKNKVLGVKTLEKKIMSDRVFLCAGAYFPLAKYLNDAGLKSFKEVRRDIDITYSSSFLSADKINLEGHKQYYFQLSPPYSNKGVVKSPIENGKFVSTNIEFKKERGLKADGHNFRLTKKVVYRRKMPRGSGLVVLGDSLCSLNPVYGQGMTVAMMQVKEIVNNIRANDYDLQSKVFKLSFIPWLLSNMAFQTKNNVINKYLMAFYKECQTDKRMHLKFIKVLHMQGSILQIINLNAFLNTLIACIRREEV